METHLSRFTRLRQGSSWGVHGAIRCQYGFCASRKAHILNELGIPILHKAMMAIDLQKVFFATIELHYFRSCPASTAAISPVDIKNSDVRIPTHRQDGLLGPMLPAHTKTKMTGLACFGKAILNGRNQFGIAVGGHRNEDSQRASASRGRDCKLNHLIAESLHQVEASCCRQDDRSVGIGD